MRRCLSGFPVRQTAVRHYQLQQQHPLEQPVKFLQHFSAFGSGVLRGSSAAFDSLPLLLLQRVVLGWETL